MTFLNIITVTSLSLLLVLGKDWRKIDVFHRQIVPSNLSVTEGVIVKAYCGSLSPVRWSFWPFTPSTSGYINLLVKHDIDSNSVQLNNLRINDSGILTCHGEYESENHIYGFHLHIVIKVKRYAEYGEILPTYADVPVGYTVILSCGSITPVEWFGATLQDQKKIVDDKAITLLDLQREHSGLYLCRGVNITMTTFWKSHH